jgi:hypothetical protein
MVVNVHCALDTESSRSVFTVTMEIYTEVPSANTREALGKLGQWLDSDS